MNDTVLVIIAFGFMILGFVGALLPVLPGTPFSWLGLLVFKYTKYADFGWTTLWISLAIAIVGLVLEYWVPLLGAKKLGGTKYGMWGAGLGLVVGLFFSPLGIIIGSFLGAFLGELYNDQNDTKRALKAATGTFIGFLFGTGINVLIATSFIAFLVFEIFWR